MPPFAWSLHQGAVSTTAGDRHSENIMRRRMNSQQNSQLPKELSMNHVPNISTTNLWHHQDTQVENLVFRNTIQYKNLLYIIYLQIADAKKQRLTFPSVTWRQCIKSNMQCKDGSQAGRRAKPALLGQGGPTRCTVLTSNLTDCFAGPGLNYITSGRAFAEVHGGSRKS